jgi:hypothetical protein
MANKIASQQQQTASTFEACTPPEEQVITFTARPRLNVNWDDLRRRISAEWRETLDFLAK